MNMVFPDERILSALNESTCETLENLAFTELAPAAEAVLRLAPEQCQGACISLGESGRLDLILEKRFLAELGSLLFSEDPGGADVGPDTLNEVLNIIAGRFLDKLHQGAADFTLGLPVGHFDLPEWNALPLRQVFCCEGREVLGVGLAGAPRSEG